MIDRKIKNRKCTLVSSQIALLAIGLSVSVYIACQWLISIDDQWDYLSLYSWSLKYDWLTDSKHLLLTAACLNLVSLSAVLAGLIFVKRWINDEFLGERRWRCFKDGNFLVYFIFLLLLTLQQAAMTVWVYRVDMDYF